MDLITQDLETAVFRNNGQQWLRVQGPEDTDSDFKDDTVSLKLFSPALDRPQQFPDGTDIPGDICAIGYYLREKESYSGEQMFMRCIVWWSIRKRPLMSTWVLERLVRK